MNFDAKKVIILSDFYDAYCDDEEWEEFIFNEDLGLPLARVMARGGVEELTTKGIEWIQETWRSLCDQLQIDHLGEYADIDAMMELSEET
jgi:hypothetical protein